MNALINPQWTAIIGSTLLDSLWQGALVLILTFLLLAFTKNARPALRFKIVLVAILALPIISGFTFYQHYQDYRVESSRLSSIGLLDLNFVYDSTEFHQTAVESSPISSSVDPLAFWREWTQKNAGIAMAIWLIGCLLFTVRMLGGFVFLNRLKSNANEITDSEWLGVLQAYCEKLKIKQKVLLKYSEAISSPLVMGVIKPVIIFPMGLIQALPTDQIEAILLHELAHIRRMDFLINIVINVLQVLYFYHPAFWWLNAQLDDEREFDCDENAMELANGRLSLVRALASVSEFQSMNHSPALAFANRKNQMLKRVQRIAQRKSNTNWLGGLLSMALLLSSFLLMSYVQKPSESPLESADVMLQAIEPEAYNLSTDPLNIDTINDFSIREMVKQDTGKVANAILEMVQPNSAVKVKTSALGAVESISISGRNLTGDEFQTYKEAYEQLRGFAKKSNLAKQTIEEEQVEDLTRRMKAEIEAISQLERVSSEQQLSKELREELEQLKMRLKEVSLQSLDSTSVLLQLKKLDMVKELENLKDALAIQEQIISTHKLIELTKGIKADSSVFQFHGKILSAQELNDLIPIGMKVVDIVDNYRFIDSVSLKALNVKLISLDSAKIFEKKGDTHYFYSTEEAQRKEARERVSVKIRSAKSDDKEVVYLIDGKERSEQDFRLIDPNYILSISVDSGSSEEKSFVKVLTKHGYKKSRYDKIVLLTVTSPDYSEAIFSDWIPEKEQLDLALKDVQGLTPMIEVNGELKPDWTFENLYNLGSGTLEKMEVIKGDKMYEFYKKKQLKKREVLIKVKTK